MDCPHMTDRQRFSIVIRRRICAHTYYNEGPAKFDALQFSPRIKYIWSTNVNLAIVGRAWIFSVMRALPAAAHHHFYSSCNRLRLLFIICCVLAFALWIQKSRRGQVPAGKTTLANNSSSSTTSARSVEARKPSKAAGIRIKLVGQQISMNSMLDFKCQV